MPNKPKNIQFHSVLTPIINQLIRERRACGYKYERQANILESFDRFICNTAVKKNELPKEIVLQWL